MYNGEHIGAKRYEAMREVVTSALAQAGKNPITGNFDMILDQNSDRNPNFYRPSGVLRGGKHQGPLRSLNMPEDVEPPAGTNGAWDTPLQERLSATASSEA